MWTWVLYGPRKNTWSSDQIRLSSPLPPPCTSHFETKVNGYALSALTLRQYHVMCISTCACSTQYIPQRSIVYPVHRNHMHSFGWGEIKLFYSIVFCSVLFYSILFYSILFYYILFYSVLFCSILFYSVLFCSILFHSILFYSILFYSVIHWI